MECDLLRSLEEDHLLHGFQRPHGEGAIQATAGEMAASHTEGHTGHLYRDSNSKDTVKIKKSYCKGRIQEGKNK